MNGLAKFFAAFSGQIVYIVTFEVDSPVGRPLQAEAAPLRWWVLPQPDSPTSPKVWPGSMSKLMPSIAFSHCRAATEPQETPTNREVFLEISDLDDGIAAADGARGVRDYRRRCFC